MGLSREVNEDAVGTWPEGGIVVVADGMGGYRGGEVASRLAVNTVLASLRPHVGQDCSVERWLIELESAVQQAHLAVSRAADSAPELAGMGTTMLAGVFLPDELAFAWVGDSRLYLVRQGSMVQLTSDHTLVQELVQAGLFESVDRAVQAGVEFSATAVSATTSWSAPSERWRPRILSRWIRVAWSWKRETCVSSAPMA